MKYLFSAGISVHELGKVRVEDGGNMVHMIRYESLRDLVWETMHPWHVKIYTCFNTE